MQQQRKIKKREALAILPDALSTGPDAMWWDLGTTVPENERCGSVAVVHVRGSLEHHPGYAGDSYDQILQRVECALAGDEEDSPPSALVLRIDSPGGVCSGLNQTVFALRKMSKDSGVPFFAYIDELAASAAYAMACACEAGIVLPPSAICGSIGVISTMYDQVEADKKMGLNFVTLTSGARKADGHPHVPVSEAAMNAEQRRVDRLAKQFYSLVADVRSISPDDAAALQAGIFLGAEAVAKGLADDVMGWDEFIAAIDDDESALAKNVQSAIGVTYKADAKSAKGERTMSLVSLKALVKRTQAALDAATDQKERKAIAGRLATYQAAVEAMKKEKYVKETVEKHSSEESEEEEEAAEESEESESEAKKSEESESKGNETERKQGDDDDKDDDGDDDEDDEEEEAAAKKAAKAALASGPSGRRALGTLTAVFAKAAKFDAMSARLAKLEASARRAEKEALIDAAVAQHRITRSMAKALREKSIDFVKGTLEMHAKPMVNIDESELMQPDPKASASMPLPPDVVNSIDLAVRAASLPNEEARNKFRAELESAQRTRLAQANGAGRY